jgi:FkbM family methyltransferase
MPNETMDRISRCLRWGANSRIPRYLRRSCARKFRRRNLGRTLAVDTLDGCHLRVVIGDNVDNEIALTGGFEPHLSQLIRELATGAHGHFLDVGCHLGYYSTLVKKVTPACGLTAVDANPVMAGRCRANLELNGMEGRVINTGVGAERAVLDFKTSLRSPSLGTFGTSPVEDGDVETIQVQVVPFSEIVDQVEGPVFLLKMDVEGFEYLALSTLRDDQVTRIANLVFEFSDERLRQCGQSKHAFAGLSWLASYEVWLLGTDGSRKRLESLSEVPDGDQNVWLKRR